MKRTVLSKLVRVLAYGWEPRLLTAGLVGVVIGISVQVSIPLIVSRIIDGALVESSAGSLLRWSGLLALSAVTAVGFREVGALAFARVGQRAVVRIRGALFGHLQRLPVGFFDRERSGRLTSFFITDARMVEKIFFPILGRTVVHVVQLVGVVVLMAVTYRVMALVAVAVMPFYAIFPLTLGRRMREAGRRTAAADAEVSAAVHESVTAIREIKSLGREAWNRRRLLERFEAVFDWDFRRSVIEFFYGFDVALYLLTVAFMYWFGGRQVLSGRLSVGELVALVWYLGLLGGPTAGLVTLQGRVQASLGAVDRIFDFLATAVEPDPVPAMDVGPIECRELVIRDLTFTYDRGDGPAIEGVSFRVVAGERVAVVGPSGAGKSTLVSLLLRFYLPQSGEILIGGREIRELPLTTLREAVGLVAQDPVLLALTIGENLRLGRPTATDAELEAAARTANAWEFIARLPQGLATPVGERGVTLSAGQRQRLAIARVVLRDPWVLLLDEATSALDAESDLLVREALQRLMAGRITLIIAHRLASVVDADRILLLDRGRLVAAGSHEQLLNRSPLYRRLASLQLEEATVDEVTR